MANEYEESRWCHADIDSDVDCYDYNECDECPYYNDEEVE